MTTYLAPTGHTSPERIAALFASCGTTREEAAFGAFLANRVPQRLTLADELVERERLNQRDRAGHTRVVSSVEHLTTGSARHAQHAIRFHYADGGSDYFPPHAN